MRRCLVVAGAVVLVAGALMAAVATREVGILKVNTPGMILRIKPDPKEKATVAIPFGKDAHLPPGTYQTGAIDLYAKDTQGQMWKLESATQFGELAKVAITTGETTVIEGGPPLQMKVLVYVTGPDNKQAEADGGSSRFVKPKAREVTVMVTYVGTKGEYYSPKVMCGRAYATRPVVRLTDYDGTVVAQGNYSYPVTGVG